LFNFAIVKVSEELMSSIKFANNIQGLVFFVYDKVFYSVTAREIILEWDKTACRFVFFYWTWTWT